MSRIGTVGLVPLALACCISVGCTESGTNATVRLQGAGASFPAPLYTKWFKEYGAQNPGVTIDYQSVGSGQGVRSVIDRNVDFGASDAAMTPEEMAEVEGGVQLLPMTAGAIVLGYNLDGVEDLKLSREAYAGIFMGTVTQWDDPLITKDNEGIAGLKGPINVVVRADSSGTTFVFSQHLSAISPEFSEKVGTNKQPNWPVGTKSKGNEGITASLTSTPGSIGYIEFGYAAHTGVSMATLQNKEGSFVKPTFESAAASLAAVEMPADLIAWLPDPEGAESYPIVTYTWIICFKEYADPAKAEALKKALHWCLTEGQKFSESLGYIPLPEPVVAKVQVALDSIHAHAGGSEKITAIPSPIRMHNDVRAQQRFDLSPALILGTK